MGGSTALRLIMGVYLECFSLQHREFTAVSSHKVITAAVQSLTLWGETVSFSETEMLFQTYAIMLDNNWMKCQIAVILLPNERHTNELFLDLKVLLVMYFLNFITSYYI